jgi:hypothetical protein
MKNVWQAKDLDKLAGVQSSNESITESALRKVDSVLYHGRKILLITAASTPLLFLISKEIAFAVHTTFFFIGLAAFAIFSCLEPLKSKDIKILTTMNICNKIIAYCFPFSSGLAATMELAPLTSTPISVITGLVCSSLLAFVCSVPIERNYIINNPID